MRAIRPSFGVCLILALATLARLSAEDITDVGSVTIDAESTEWNTELHKRSRWWSLQPPKAARPPTVSGDHRTVDPIDQFILNSLKAAKLSPAKPATAETLLRRTAYVLTGLPASPEKLVSFLEAFRVDDDAAFERLVEELLASPHFGERFARHWMDVVRYTDTYGYEWDNPAKGAWEYRDYLIRAFNSDVPFDQLIREQIAGDLLSEPRINSSAGVNESLIGPMFYHMGEHRHETSLQFNGVHQEMVNNKIDAFSSAFLAMTMACARCHDHKLDAISQRDYYALAGVFMSPRWTSREIDSPGKYDSQIAELKRLRGEIRHKISRSWQSRDLEATSGSQLRQWALAKRSSFEKATLANIAFPLAQISVASDETLSEVWANLVNQWRDTRESRLKTNAEQFSSITKFDSPNLPKGWTMEGEGLRHGYVRDGAPLVSLTTDSLIDRLLPRGYHTHALSSKLAGAVRLPEQTAIPGKFVSLDLQGGEWAGYLVSPQNAFQNESVTFFAPGASAQWITIADENLKNGVTRLFTEIATSSLNPNFPPRVPKAVVGEMKLPAKDDGYNRRSWFSLTGIATHEHSGVPANTLEAFVPLFEETPPSTLDEAWQHLADWFSSAIDRWASGNPTPGDIAAINWLLQQNLLPNRTDEAPDIATLVKRYREVETQIGFPRSVISMDERQVSPLDYRINLRGNVDKEGPAVPRNFLGIFSGKHRVNQSKMSGRLELAQYLSSPANPQTARVYVNRLWYWVFGTGLVATPNDFGALGDRPSHPELLDWLATTFMEEGWSTKKLVRRLVRSQTFRQSGNVDPIAAERDPKNRLLHHYPTRRLEGEAIRDSLFAVAGSLDSRLYGPPINPSRSVEDPLKRLLSGPLDSHGRRSIYIEMSIMDPPKFLMGFNLPDPKLPTGRRDVTNVPAQALLLLNHPTVTLTAERWAKRLVEDGSETPQERIAKMFARAFSRSATRDELKRWSRTFETFSQAEDPMTDKKAWTDMAHAIFNTKEFIYYR